MEFLCWGSPDGQAIHGAFETDEELFELLKDFENDYGFGNGHQGKEPTVQEVFESLRLTSIFEIDTSNSFLEIQ